MKEASSVGRSACHRGASSRRPVFMLHAGLDLSRKKIDVCLLSQAGEIVEEWASPPDADGVRGLARRAGAHGLSVRGVIESMTGARFVHDQLEELGWEVLIADAAKVKGLAPLACKTDKIDARVLAVLSQRDLVPEIWLPDPSIRRERELARFRLHLVRHRTTLKNRIHAGLVAFGKPCPVSDLFGHAGRELLDRLQLPEPWRSNIDVSLRLIDDLDLQIAALTVQLKRQGVDHRYIPLLVTAPGLGWINAYTIASEIGDIERFPSPTKLCGYTGLCPRVYQSGQSDRRGPISKQGSRYLRWALFEAALNACKHPYCAGRHQHIKRRLGRRSTAGLRRTTCARHGGPHGPVWLPLGCAGSGAHLVRCALRGCGRLRA